MLRSQIILMVSGAALIIVGIALIVVQMWLQANAPEIPLGFDRSLDVEAMGAKASLRTTYVGLVLVIIGAILETIGVLVSKPWKKDDGN